MYNQLRRLPPFRVGTRFCRIGRSITALAVALSISVLSLLLLVSTAMAAATPHQTAVGEVSSCGSCHRLHGGVGGMIQAEPELCLSCHGHDASGAVTDVEWGVLRGQGVGLRGGGFSQALMDVSLNGSPEAKPTTSAHGVGAGSGMAWGFGSASVASAPGTGMTLRCTSCHDPHGNGGYRSLRAAPLGSWSDAKPVQLADETNKDYSVKYSAGFQRDLSYVPSNIGDWCALCHTRYQSDPSSVSYPSGDAYFQNMHSTVVPGSCLSCHVAHGTSSTAGPNSGAALWPDGRQGAGASDSRLLAVDNRGVCTSCHVHQITAN